MVSHSTRNDASQQQHNAIERPRCRTRDHLLLFKRTTHCALSSSSVAHTTEPRIQLKIGFTRRMTQTRCATEKDALFQEDCTCMMKGGHRVLRRRDSNVCFCILSKPICQLASLFLKYKVCVPSNGITAALAMRRSQSDTGVYDMVDRRHAPVRRCYTFSNWMQNQNRMMKKKVEFGASQCPHRKPLKDFFERQQFRRIIEHKRYCCVRRMRLTFVSQFSSAISKNPGTAQKAIMKFSIWNSWSDAGKLCESVLRTQQHRWFCLLIFLYGLNMRIIRRLVFRSNAYGLFSHVNLRCEVDARMCWACSMFMYELMKSQCESNVFFMQRKIFKVNSDKLWRSQECYFVLAHTVLRPDTYMLRCQTACNTEHVIASWQGVKLIAQNIVSQCRNDTGDWTQANE